MSTDSLSTLIVTFGVFGGMATGFCLGYAAADAHAHGECVGLARQERAAKCKALIPPASAYLCDDEK